MFNKEIYEDYKDKTVEELKEYLFINDMSDKWSDFNRDFFDTLNKILKDREVKENGENN